jgi:16S rRNA (guanine(966)-N(2))-methyltransferase RsmD
MRIIGGKFKGSNIEAPRGLLSRPPLALIRESVFNVLGDWIVGKSVLDLFGGSGSMGIEALSRGAARLHYVDNARRCVGMATRNLEKIGISDRSVITRQDAIGFIRAWPGPRFDLVFVDPPFLSGKVGEILACLPDVNILADSGVLICRYHRREEVPVPGVFELFKKRKFGESIVIFLRQT